MKNIGFTLSKENYKFIIIGCAVVILGYVLMSGGGTEDPTVFNGEELFSFRRITLAPILVMSGYGIVLFGVLLMLAIKTYKKIREKNNTPK